MSKKANTTVIGAFVIGAVLLAVAGIVILGGGKYFAKKHNYVVYFSGSVKGLNIGSPVLFNGVKVGQVIDINMEFDFKKMAFRIPVIVQLIEGTTTAVNVEHYEGFEEATSGELMLDMINRGLKAQLAPQSFITGLLYVKLDFSPEKKSILYSAESPGSHIKLIEIPSIPSDIEELARTFENLPLKQIADNLGEMTTSIEKLVSSPELPAILGNIDNAAATLNQTMISADTLLVSLTTDLKKTIDNINWLAHNLNRQIEPMAKGFLDTTGATTRVMKQARDTLSLETGPAAALVADLKRTAESATAALEQADATLKTLDSLSDKDSELVYTLNTTLEEIALAARSIRTVADYLERHPESLLRGKRDKGGN